MRFPFGYGLSYTVFAHSEWTKEGDHYLQTVTNKGDRYGGEVAQLYIDGELRGFEKVYLQPGQSATVRIKIEEDGDAEYPDEYLVPDELPRYPVTLESRFTDLKQTFPGRVIFHTVLMVARVREWQAKCIRDPAKRKNRLKSARFLRMAMESNSLRAMTMSAGKYLPYNAACAMVEFTNCHFFAGVRQLFSRVRVPRLPKHQKNRSK